MIQPTGYQVASVGNMYENLALTPQRGDQPKLNDPKNDVIPSNMNDMNAIILGKARPNGQYSLEQTRF